MTKTWKLRMRTLLGWGMPVLALALFGSRPAAAAGPIRIVILGDSIDADEPPERPIQGWGTYLQGKLVNVQVTNLALSGRSTKSFLYGETNKQGGHNPPKNWIKAQSLPADYWLIKFGGNDSHPPSDERHTDPDTDYAANLKIFIDTARKLGIKPILITPPDRPSHHGVVSGNNQTNIEPYAIAARRVAKQENVPLIDMFAFSRQWYASLGEDGLQKFLPVELGGHLNLDGANFVAGWVAQQLVKVVPQFSLAPVPPAAK